jgi:hypothetical protein
VEERVQVLHLASIDGVILRAAVVWEQDNDKVTKEQVVKNAIVPECGGHSVP